MFSRLVRYSSRRSWSDYILAKRVDGKLVEAEITTDDSRMSMSTKMTASIMLNGKDGVAMLGGVMPIVEENQPGKVGYVKTMKGEDWWGYVKYDDVMKQKDVSFKCKHSQFNPFYFDKSTPITFDVVAKINNPDFREAVNIRTDKNEEIPVGDETSSHY